MYYHVQSPWIYRNIGIEWNLCNTLRHIDNSVEYNRFWFGILDLIHFVVQQEKISYITWMLCGICYTRQSIWKWYRLSDWKQSSIYPYHKSTYTICNDVFALWGITTLGSRHAQRLAFSKYSTKYLCYYLMRILTSWQLACAGITRWVDFQSSDILFYFFEICFDLHGCHISRYSDKCCMVFMCIVSY